MATWETMKARPAIVMVPVRGAALLFGATEKLVEPFPEPLAPPVMVTHDVLLVAVQLHPVAAITLTDELVPGAATDRLEGEIEYEHQAALWLTVNGCPAIVRVPVRGCVVVLAVALNVTVPFPLPAAPPVTVSHVMLLTAVHVQPLMAVTLVDPAPPLDATAWLVDESVKVQAAAA